MINKVALPRCLCRMIVFDRNFARRCRARACPTSDGKSITEKENKNKKRAKNRLTVPKIPRLQHPEVNSRRPGRFEVRLGASRKRSIIPNQTSLLRQPQVCAPDAKSVLLVFSPFHADAMFRFAAVTIFKSCKSLVFKKAFRDSRSLLLCRASRSFRYARRVNVDIWIYGSGAAKRFSKRAMVVVGSVGKLFHPSSPSRAIQTCKSK